MTDDVLDAVIVGQGLAGTTLAWRLLEAGQRILVFDDAAPVSASKISAGLFTPIMGQKFTRNDDAAIAAAHAFYRRIEVRLGISLLQKLTAVRLFADATEAALFAQRRGALEQYLLSPQPDPLLPPDLVDMPCSGFAMHSAQLDVRAYLEASRAALPSRRRRVSAATDVVAADDHLVVCDVAARRVIFCEGFQGQANPWFATLPWQNVQGDMLLIHPRVPLPRVSLHARHWLAPTPDPHEFRLGATAHWSRLDMVPSAEGRATLTAEADRVLRCGYDIVDHVAAVRPVIRGGPVVTASERDPRVWLFNGLGTKGATRAPLLADEVVRRWLSERMPP